MTITTSSSPLGVFSVPSPHQHLQTNGVEDPVSATLWNVEGEARYVATTRWNNQPAFLHDIFFSETSGLYLVIASGLVFTVSVVRFTVYDYGVVY